MSLSRSCDTSALSFSRALSLCARRRRRDTLVLGSVEVARVFTRQGEKCRTVCALTCMCVSGVRASLSLGVSATTFAFVRFQE